jgi:hypothetical protein
MSAVGLLQCPSCKADWPEAAATGGTVVCGKCARRFSVEVFPALSRTEPRASSEGDVLVAGNEASCFYHAERKAVVPCDACGRFLCTLCDLEIGNVHWCPACLEKGRSSHKVATVDSQRISYPDIALLLATLPLLMWPISLITAPAALFVAIRGWSKPPSLTGNRKRIRTWLAIVLAVLEIVGWGLLFVALFNESVGLFRG